MPFIVHSKSLKGRRETNEDQEIIFMNASGEDKNYAPVNLFCVFDGHGGKFVSTYLKQNIWKYLVEKGLKYPLSKNYINKVYDKIQQDLVDNHYEKASHCGSTCLISIHFKKKGKQYIQVLNTGDSRAVICSDNFGNALTLDHKPTQFDEKKRIDGTIKKTGEDKKDVLKFDGYDWRIKGLAVSRAFGDLDTVPHVTHRPDIKTYKLDKSDCFMVLACDGLWDVFSNQDAVNFILNHMNVDDGKMVIKDKRINLANAIATHAIDDLKSTDNITCIVVLFSGLK